MERKTTWIFEDIKYSNTDVSEEEMKIIQMNIKNMMFFEGFSNLEIDISMLKINIGKKVFKPSGNPFKSTFKINTIKDVIKHEKIEVAAYTFEEDDSYVAVSRCEVIFN